MPPGDERSGIVWGVPFCLRVVHILSGALCVRLTDVFQRGTNRGNYKCGETTGYFRYI